MQQHTITLRIDGVEYVAVPVKEYRKLRGKPVDAVAWTRTTVGASLRQARETAGLTQAALAKKLKRSQPMIARAEAGKLRVGERYVSAVLKACKLPADWTASA